MKRQLLTSQRIHGLKDRSESLGARLTDRIANSSARRKILLGATTLALIALSAPLATAKQVSTFKQDPSPHSQANKIDAWIKTVAAQDKELQQTRVMSKSLTPTDLRNSGIEAILKAADAEIAIAQRNLLELRTQAPSQWSYAIRKLSKLRGLSPAANARVNVLLAAQSTSTVWSRAEIDKWITLLIKGKPRAERLGIKLSTMTQTHPGFASTKEAIRTASIPFDRSMQDLRDALARNGEAGIYARKKLLHLKELNRAARHRVLELLVYDTHPSATAYVVKLAAEAPGTFRVEQLHYLAERKIAPAVQELAKLLSNEDTSMRTKQRFLPQAATLALQGNDAGLPVLREILFGKPVARNFKAHELSLFTAAVGLHALGDHEAWPDLIGRYCVEIEKLRKTNTGQPRDLAMSLMTARYFAQAIEGKHISFVNTKRDCYAFLRKHQAEITTALQIERGFKQLKK